VENDWQVFGDRRSRYAALAWNSESDKVAEKKNLYMCINLKVKKQTQARTQRMRQHVTKSSKELIGNGGDAAFCSRRYIPRQFRLVDSDTLAHLPHLLPLTRLIQYKTFPLLPSLRN